ncbi:GAF domain-containing protein [Spiribacter sp. 221]|uniref:GAF domain-containing protein n=1 Tax=Spiribacter onubensis TaxID=3122420 RepID=UPI00349F489E
MDTARYYPGFADDWQAPLEALADAYGVDSLLIMRSTPTHMVTAVSAGPRQDTYHPGDAGPKSVNAGCHKLYCEQVVNEDRPLEVADARTDPEWAGNEDLVRFGLGTYLGYPLHDADGQVLGTLCALHGEGFDFDAGEPPLRQELAALAARIDAAIAAREG